MTQYRLVVVMIAMLVAVIARSDPYRIEIICFENVAHSNFQEEFPEYVGSIAVPKLNAEITASDLAQNLGAELSLLQKELLILQQSPQHKYLYHQAWLQNLVDQKRATPIYFYGGNQLEQYHEIEGLLSVRPLRNLFHVKLDIIFRALNENHEIEEYRLTQTARIKAQDPYYFDHPKFGALMIFSLSNQPELIE